MCADPTNDAGGCGFESGVRAAPPVATHVKKGSASTDRVGTYGMLHRVGPFMQKVRGRSTRNLPQNPVKECSKKKKRREDDREQPRICGDLDRLGIPHLMERPEWAVPRRLTRHGPHHPVAREVPRVRHSRTRADPTTGSTKARTMRGCGNALPPASRIRQDDGGS